MLNKFNKDQKYLILTSLVFILLFIWRPFYFGFYADDWNYFLGFEYFDKSVYSPFSGESFVYFLNQWGNRPVAAFFFYLFFSVCHLSIFSWQAGLLVLLVVFVYSYKLFLKEFLKFLQIEESSWKFSVVFLTLPFLTPIVSWATTAMPATSLIFFNLTAYYFFKEINNKRYNFLISSILYLLSCLAYESFYLQAYILVLFALVYSKDYSISYKRLLKAGLFYTGALIIAIAWNRLSIPLFPYNVNKATNPFTLQTFVANVISLPYVLYASFNMFAPIFILVILTILVFIIKNRRKYAFFNKSNILLLSLITSGILFSLLIYAVAGYSIWGLGMRGRTMITISFYLPLIIMLIVVHLKKINPKTSILIYFLSIILMSLASFTNSLDWVKAYSLLKESLARVDYKAIDSTDKNAIILIEGEFRYNWVAVYDATSSAGAQFNYAPYILGIRDGDIHKHVDRKFIIGRQIIHPVKNTNFINYWANDTLNQYYKQVQNSVLKGSFFTKENRIVGSELYLLNTDNGRMDKIKDSSYIELQPIKNYDYWLTEIWTYIKK